MRHLNIQTMEIYCLPFFNLTFSAGETHVRGAWVGPDVDTGHLYLWSTLIITWLQSFKGADNVICLSFVNCPIAVLQSLEQCCFWNNSKLNRNGDPNFLCSLLCPYILLSRSCFFHGSPHSYFPAPVPFIA